MKRPLTLLALSLMLTGCLKTAEQKRREQHDAEMSQQLSDSQNIVADLTVTLKGLQTQINELNGRVEELQRGQSEFSGADLKGMGETVSLIKQQLQALTENQDKQAAELQQQRGFIEKVTEKLGKLGEGQPAQKKNAKDDVQEAWTLIRAKKYAQARELLERLVDDSQVSAADHNKALHALGSLEYRQKNWEKGLVFFSKIYTKYPKSSLAPDSLLHIGRSLRRLGKKDEARAAFEEVKSGYAGTPSAGLAQQELRQL